MTEKKATTIDEVTRGLNLGPTTLRLEGAIDARGLALFLANIASVDAVEASRFDGSTSERGTRWSFDLVMRCTDALRGQPSNLVLMGDLPAPYDGPGRAPHLLASAKDGIVGVVHAELATLGACFFRMAGVRTGIALLSMKRPQGLVTARIALDRRSLPTWLHDITTEVPPIAYAPENESVVLFDPERLADNPALPLREVQLDDVSDFHLAWLR